MSEYSEWIKSVREKLKMSQAIFADNVFHFANINGEEVCIGYHRNSVGNWEKGNNLPYNTETVVTLAILDYNGVSDRWTDANTEERNKRYTYVQQCLSRIIGRTLYSRNLNDALLMAVARGVIGMQEVPNFRGKLAKMIEQVKLDRNDKKKISLSRDSETIEAQLMNADTAEDVERIILSWKAYFALGARTVGERMIESYESSERRKYKLSFNKATTIYAAKYMDSSNRLFNSDFSASREWIIDFCVRMRFSREEINEVLGNANMADLSDDEKSYEYYIEDINYTQIGSVQWYEYILELENESVQEQFRNRYPSVEYLSVDRKVLLCVLIGCYVKKYGISSIPSIDGILEVLPGHKEFADLFSEIEKENVEAEDIIEKPSVFFDPYLFELKDMLEVVILEKITNKEREAYDAYLSEYHRYFDMARSKYDSNRGIDECNQLLYVAAMSYSIFTGKLYRGTVSEEDMELLKRQFKEKGEDGEYIYRLYRSLWVVFLETVPIYYEENRGYYAITGREKTKSEIFNMETLMQDMAEAWLCCR